MGLCPILGFQGCAHALLSNESTGTLRCVHLMLNCCRAGALGDPCRWEALRWEGRKILEEQTSEAGFAPLCVHFSGTTCCPSPVAAAGRGGAGNMCLPTPGLTLDPFPRRWPSILELCVVTGTLGPHPSASGYTRGA